jgi:hypothetical protein
MATLPAEVADHLDKVVAATRLLPSTDRVQALDTAVSMLLAEQAAAARDLAADGSLEGSGCKTAGSWLRVHLRRPAAADDPAFGVPRGRCQPRATPAREPPRSRTGPRLGDQEAQGWSCSWSAAFASTLPGRQRRTCR